MSEFAILIHLEPTILLCNFEDNKLYNLLDSVLFALWHFFLSTGFAWKRFEKDLRRS